MPKIVRRVWFWHFQVAQTPLWWCHVLCKLVYSSKSRYCVPDLIRASV